MFGLLSAMVPPSGAFVAISGALALTMLVWRALRPTCKVTFWEDGDHVKYDYVVVGGGPSGCMLAAELTKRFPGRSVCVVNKGGAPAALWRVYMVNLIGVVLPWLVPHEKYSLKSQKRQFANCTLLGGNSNINAGVAPVPREADIVASLGESFLERWRVFSQPGGVMDSISENVSSTPGLERLSSDLNTSGVHGGRIRVLKRGFWRLHPVDLLPTSVRVLVGSAKRILFDMEPSLDGGKKPKATGVFCELSEAKSPVALTATRKVFLCAGAIESPALLIKSGIGPKEIVQRVVEENQVVSYNESVGANLQDHWVGRASAVVPARYAYPRLYPFILGYKHQADGVAIGFGKFQLMGRNLLSFATTQCANPGRLVLTPSGALEPYLPVGPDDMEQHCSGVAAHIGRLAKLGVHVLPRVGPLSPNWHLSCTLGIDTVCDASLAILGTRGLYVADISCLRTIVPFNTQLVSYFVAFALAAQET